MRFRRLFALLTSVTMLHLRVVAGDTACATHGIDGHHGASSQAVPAHAMPMGGKAGTPPCDLPTQQHCCEALVGCGVDSAVTVAHEGFVAGASASGRILIVPHAAPASFASAPEPPPPKA